MEERQKLHLLLGYGGLSLLFGFAAIMVLTFTNFPFKPGSFVAAMVTLVTFTLAFYISAKIISKYVEFNHDDVRFLLRLAGIMGSLLILWDVISGTKFTTFLSNASFLAVFLLSTRRFLKPKGEEVSLPELRHEAIHSILYVWAITRKYSSLGAKKTMSLLTPAKGRSLNVSAK